LLHPVTNRLDPQPWPVQASKYTCCPNAKQGAAISAARLTGKNDLADPSYAVCRVRDVYPVLRIDPRQSELPGERVEGERRTVFRVSDLL